MKPTLEDGRCAMGYRVNGVRYMGDKRCPDCCRLEKVEGESPRESGLAIIEQQVIRLPFDPHTRLCTLIGDMCVQRAGYIIRGVTWTFNFHGIEAGKLSGNHLINFSKYRISCPEN